MTCESGEVEHHFSTAVFYYLDTAEINKNRQFRKISGMDAFVKFRENLVRHENGTYYLRAKVAGKCFYASLKTTSLKIAKIKRNDRLAYRFPSPGAITVHHQNFIPLRLRLPR
jgi:hypothetical protein